MKKLIVVLTLALAAVAVQAQSNSIPVDTAGFISGIPSWLTVNDTNSTTLVSPGIEIENITIYNNGQNLVDELGARFNFKSATTPQPSFSSPYMSVAMRYAGIGGVLDGGNAGFGYSVTKYDTRVSASVLAGYMQSNKAGYAAPQLMVEKVASKLILGTGIRYDVMFQGKQQTRPDILVKVGFKW